MTRPVEAPAAGPLELIKREEGKDQPLSSVSLTEGSVAFRPTVSWSAASLRSA